MGNKDNSPEKVVERYSNGLRVLFYYFIGSQLIGLALVVKIVLFQMSALSRMLNEAGSDVTSLIGQSQPKYEYNTLESFLSGLTFSWSAFFLAIMIVNGYRLKRPYREKSYKYILYSFPIMVFFFILGQRGIFLGDFSKVNTGTVGSVINIFIGLWIFLATKSPVMKKWSKELIPPPPNLND